MPTFADYLQKQNSPSAASTGAPVSESGSGMPSFSQFLSSQPATPAPAAKPGILSSIWGGIKTVASDIKTAAVSPFQTAPPQDAITNPSNAPTDTVKNLVTQLTSAGQQMQEGVGQIIANHQAISGNPAGAIGVANLTLGAINAAFAPVNAVINYAQHIPGVGYIATGLNSLFNIIATGGSDAAEGAVDALPISQGMKDQITPVAKQAGALVAQIIAGKVGIDKLSTVTGHVNDIINTVNGAKAATENKTISPTDETPGETKFEPPAKPAPAPAAPETPSVEQPVPVRKISDIQMGPKAKPSGTLPEIQMGEPTPEFNPSGKTKFEPVEEPIVTPKAVEPTPDVRQTSSKPPIVTPKAPEIAPKAPETAPSAPQTPVEKPVQAPAAAKPEAPVGVGEKATTKVASDINEKLVKQGMENIPPEELSKYTKGSYKDSDTQVAQMMTDDIESVKQMARTGENIPSDVHPQILFNAVKALADTTKDYGLSRDLAKSPLGSARSEHAAQLGSAGYKYRSDSGVDALRKANEVKSGGEKGAKAVKAEATKAKATVTKTAARLIDYERILKQITC